MLEKITANSEHSSSQNFGQDQREVFKLLHSPRVSCTFQKSARNVARHAYHTAETKETLLFKATVPGGCRSHRRLVGQSALKAEMMKGYADLYEREKSDR